MCGRALEQSKVEVGAPWGRSRCGCGCALEQIKVGVDGDARTREDGVCLSVHSLWLSPRSTLSVPHGQLGQPCVGSTSMHAHCAGADAPNTHTPMQVLMLPCTHALCRH